MNNSTVKTHGREIVETHGRKIVETHGRVSLQHAKILIGLRSDPGFLLVGMATKTFTPPAIFGIHSQTYFH